MFFNNVRPAKLEIALRKLKFLTKMKLIGNYCNGVLRDISVNMDLEETELKYGLNRYTSFAESKSKLMLQFKNTLEV